MKCDFCSADRPAWAYPCDDFQVDAAGIASNGAWAACEDCHTLIKNGKWDALAERSAKTHPMRYRFSYEVIRDSVGLLHATFRKHRSGEPVRIEELPPDPLSGFVYCVRRGEDLPPFTKFARQVTGEGETYEIAFDAAYNNFMTRILDDQRAKVTNAMALEVANQRRHMDGTLAPDGRPRQVTIYWEVACA